MYFWGLYRLLTNLLVFGTRCQGLGIKVAGVELWAAFITKMLFVTVNQTNYTSQGAIIAYLVINIRAITIILDINMHFVAKSLVQASVSYLLLTSPCLIIA